MLSRTNNCVNISCSITHLIHIMYCFHPIFENLWRNKLDYKPFEPLLIVFYRGKRKRLWSMEDAKGTDYWRSTKKQKIMFHNLPKIVNTCMKRDCRDVGFKYSLLNKSNEVNSTWLLSSLCLTSVQVHWKWWRKAISLLQVLFIIFLIFVMWEFN